MNEFTHREVPRLGRRLFRLGLSGSFGLDEAGCREALERLQYVFWSPRMKALTPALRDALARDRDRYVVSAGPLLGYFPGAVRRAAEAALQTLCVDSLDVFQLYWLGKMSAFTAAVRVAASDPLPDTLTRGGAPVYLATDSPSDPGGTMKNRSFIAAAVCISAAVFLLMTVEAFARIGGSRSSGSRGSRSMSTPTRPSQPSTPSSTSTSPSTTSATPSQVPPPQTGGFMRGVMGGLAGGFLGSMLFGGLGGGGLGDGGGFGMLDIVLLGGLGYLAYRFFVKRRQEPPTWPSQVAGTTPGPYAAPAAVADTAGEDRNKGLEYIRRMDPAFDEKTFGETASDAFFRLQGGWTRRDLSPVSGLLTDEMRATLQADADALKAKGQINRLENISVRNVEITEAWQESGQDYATVLFQANLLDYTTDEAGKVLSGSDTVPVKFEEFWTFTRPVGPGVWRLSSIQQPG